MSPQTRLPAEKRPLTWQEWLGFPDASLTEWAKAAVTITVIFTLFFIGGGH